MLSDVTNKYQNFTIDVVSLSYPNDKLSSKNILTPDGKYIFIALTTQNYLIGINTSTLVVDRLLKFAETFNDILNISSDEGGDTMVIRTSHNFYIYRYTNRGYRSWSRCWCLCWCWCLSGCLGRSWWLQESMEKLD